MSTNAIPTTPQALRGTPCWRKTRYHSKWTAWEVARQAREREEGDRSIEAYWCRSCHCFHIGRSRMRR